MQDSNDQPSAPKPRFASPRHTAQPIWLLLLKSLIAVIVGAAIFRTAFRAMGELNQTAFDWNEVGWNWLILAALLYALAQIPMATYWHRILAAVDVRVSFTLALRGYVAGQLGKYVPGKFMVVVLRSSLLQLPRSCLRRAITSIFVETFTFVAVGAFVAGLGALVFFRDERLLQLFAAAIMIAMVILTSPKLVHRLLRIVDRPAGASCQPTSGQLNGRLLLHGWIMSLTAWTLSSASLYAALLALPTARELPMTWAMFFRLGTSLAAAVVLGFASMLPGGLGAREYVLDRLLVPLLGEFRALAATILLRTVWLLTEVVCSTILYGMRRIESN